MCVMKQSLPPARSSPRILIYDATLREGSQAEGIAFSTEDRLRIAEELDLLGVHYVEGGFPASNPSAREFFKRASSLRLRHARLAAFGSTRRKFHQPENDPGLAAILETGVRVVTLVGKSWELHVRDVLRCTLKQNLQMIEDSVQFLRGEGLEVIFDAEHFFDGYKDNPKYALETLEAAVRGGASMLCVCDTNGGSLPHEISQIVSDVMERCPAPVGIHAHNDCGLAVANSLAAVRAGATQVQCTINGYGERCGNANLCTIVPNLVLKMGIPCIERRHLERLTHLSRLVSELANVAPDERQPYVGSSAFAHKGGMHIDAVQKNARTYEHADPAVVGNQRRLLLSEHSGRSLILLGAHKYADHLDKDAPEVQELSRLLNELEHQGYQFEAAEGSFELLMMKTFGRRKELFHRAGFRIIVEQREDGTQLAEATIKVRLGDRTVHTAAEGDGPVNALDNALRKALAEFYPAIRRIKLSDYKVRVLNKGGTASKVRVLIQSTDGRSTWGTVGVSENIIDASWQALLDSIEYGLMYRTIHKAAGKSCPKRAAAKPPRSS